MLRALGEAPVLDLTVLMKHLLVRGKIVWGVHIPRVLFAPGRDFQDVRFLDGLSGTLPLGMCFNGSFIYLVYRITERE